MKLISLQNINQYYQPGQKEIALEKGQKITPSAKDFLLNQGVRILYNNSSAKTTNAGSSSSQSELVERIINILITNYNIVNQTTLLDITAKVLKQIKE
ncbi:MAG: hypothetical protein ACRCTQ_06015 [Brevinemataceae bacterium]